MSTKAARRSGSSSNTAVVELHLAGVIRHGAGVARLPGRQPVQQRPSASHRPTWSAHTCRAICSSQVRADASARNRASAGSARRYTSWVRSSAEPGSPKRAHSRHTSGWVRRTKAVSATRSPSAAASASRVRSSTRGVSPDGNHRGKRDDYTHMDCIVIREAVSAFLDGEEGPVDEATTDAHLAGCAGCRAWREDLVTLHRMVRVRPADEVPDLSATIVEAHQPVARGRAQRVGRAVRGPLAEPISTARWALFVVALTQLVLAGPPLLLGEDAGATVHVARELGSFDVALAIGLLVVAWQPARAWGLLPVAAALGLVMVGTAALDVIDGSTRLVGETPHLLDLAGVALLWMVARGAQLDERPRLTTPAV